VLELLTALSLVMIIEGIMPFISPGRWRELVLQVVGLDDSALRRMGLISMALGLVLLLWLK
jgi:uncharacterized protein YjeT (DUF2065 family)